MRRPVVRPGRSVTGRRAGLAGRDPQARGPGRVGAGGGVRAGRGRVDGGVSQPLRRGRQVPGVGHREQPPDEDGPGGHGYRGPGRVRPGNAAQPGRPAPVASPGRRRAMERPGAEVRERPGLPAQLAAFRDRRQRGEHLADRLPPGQVAARERAPLEQRLKGPLLAGAVRAAAPLASGLVSGHTALQNDAAAVFVTGRFVTGSLSFHAGSQPGAVNPGAQPPGPPRGCGPPGAPRPGCPARRRPAAG